MSRTGRGDPGGAQVRGQADYKVYIISLNRQEQGGNLKMCRVRKSFIKYYFILLFLLCFVTPALITVSLNVFITFAVRNTHHEAVSHHQWLTLAACVFM